MRDSIHIKGSYFVIEVPASVALGNYTFVVYVNLCETQFEEKLDRFSEQHMVSHETISGAFMIKL